MTDKKKELKFKLIDEDDHVMTREEFIGCVECGDFIDYDGFGEFATETEKLDLGQDAWLWPSMLDNPKFKWPEWATHVVWYNR